MTKFLVLDNYREVIGKFTSVTKALKAVEQVFQCGTSEELLSVKRSIKRVGFAVVHHAMSDKITCTIELV